MMIIDGEMVGLNHYIIREIRGNQKVDTLIRNPDTVNEIYNMMVNRAVHNNENVIIELINNDLGIPIKSYDSSIDNK